MLVSNKYDSQKDVFGKIQNEMDLKEKKDFAIEMV